jgi:uncharacterized protein (TIGR00369 family)
MTQAGSMQNTHLKIDPDLVGSVEYIDSGKSARVTLSMGERMKADESGFVHGGFTFGLADFAAMVAVNDPFVVLLSAQVSFRRPVIVGDVLTAHAAVVEGEGRKRKVSCEVYNQDRVKVFEGEFLCMTLPRHVLG